MIKLRPNVKKYIAMERELIRFRAENPKADEEEYYNKLDVIWWKFDEKDMHEMRTVVEGRVGWEPSVAWYDAFDLS